MHRRLLCTITAVFCLLAPAMFGRNVFVLPDDQSNQVATVNAEPFSYGTTVSTVAGATNVIAAPNAQAAGTLKYYVIGSGTSDNLGVLTGRFPNLTEARRIPVGTAISAAELTPDGRFLIVTGSGGTAIINTATDTLVNSLGSLDTGNAPVDVAISPDSRYAYVLSTSSTRLTAIDLSTNTVARTAQVPSSGNTVVVAPSGVIYVSGPNQITELDPNSLAVRAVIAIAGSPEALQFTPNGRYALARNTLTFSGKGLIAVDLQTRKAVDTPNSASFTNFALVGDDLGFGLLAGGGMVEVRIGTDGTISQLTPVVNGSLPAGINDLVPTGELPRSRYLVITASGQTYNLNLSSRDLAGPVAVPVRGGGVSTLPLSTSSVQAVLQYNATQTAAAGTTTLPMTLVAYDGSGLPVPSLPVSFSTTASGISFLNAATSTSSMGSASASIAIPTGRTGSIPVTATVANRTVTFTVNVGDPGLPGGTPGGGSTGNRFVIVSGQGAAIRAGFSTGLDSDPLQVRYTDANGSPISNATISWQLLDQTGGALVVNGATNCPTAETTARCNATDSDGAAIANLSTILLQNALIPYRRYQVQATAPDGQALTFYVVAVRLTNGIGGIQIGATTANNSTVTARSGEVLSSAFVYRVVSIADSVPVPSVGLTVTSSNQDPNAGPVASCRGGTALSDEQGNLTCDLVISGRTGSTNLVAKIGASILYYYQLNVTVGAPAAVRIISGNNQSVNGGQQASFTVQVVDAAGNSLQGVGVDWSIPQSATVVSQQNLTDSSGRASLTVQMPTTAGTYFVRANSNGITASFQVSVAAVAGNLAVAGGGDQTAIVGQQFGQPLQVRVVDGSNNAVSGVSVTFRVTSGSATVGSQTVTTNAQGVASTTVTAGATPGPIVVTASTGIYSVNFNLTSRLAGPSFNASSIVNGASFQPGISPGSIAYIRVAGIAPTLRGSVLPANLVGPRPTTLADVQVLFNGIAAPIFSVNNVNGEESVAVQVPFEAGVGAANVTITGPGGGSTTVQGVQIDALKPGVFTWVDPSNSQTYAVAVRPDGSFVSAGNPARRGEVIRVYATGLGQTNPGTGTNRVGVAGQTISAPLVVGVNNAGTRLVSSELMAGTVGVYVVALEIPADTASGPYQAIGIAAVRTDGGAEYANSVFIPIQ